MTDRLKDSSAAANADRRNKDSFQRDGGGKGHPRERSQEEIDRELDRALDDSFPSSDPPSISQPGPTEPASDPKVKP
jgi:hypothetical protein